MKEASAMIGCVLEKNRDIVVMVGFSCHLSKRKRGEVVDEEEALVAVMMMEGPKSGPCNYTAILFCGNYSRGSPE